MTALERIEEIKKSHEETKNNTGLIRAIYGSGSPMTKLTGYVEAHDAESRIIDEEFLVRAFEVMWKIAAEAPCDGYDDWTKEEVEKEFEKRMIEDKSGL